MRRSAGQDQDGADGRGRLLRELTPFRIDVEPRRRCVVVAPVGEIDMGTIVELRERLRELEESGFDSLVLDLRSVTFMDSSGLHLILSEARRADLQLRIIPGGDNVQRLFELTGTLDEVSFVAPNAV